MAQAKQEQKVFFVSDRTGKTAESIGMSLLTQFTSVEFSYKNHSFVSSVEDACEVAREIRRVTELDGKAPIVISTIVDREVEEEISRTEACVMSLFNVFIDPLEQFLGVSSSHSAGRPHEDYDAREYLDRIAAVEYTLRADDGMMVASQSLDEADVILLGVSRSAKTPTSLYLAMNFSVKAANYPLTEDDLDKTELPHFIEPYLDKTVGLTIQPERLSAIRQQRRPNSSYASVERCRQQVQKAMGLMRAANLKILDSTSTSIEEIAVNIVREKNLLCRR
jgi:regulator of PEP synthase PpsR (kinase-PPPase family)